MKKPYDPKLREAAAEFKALCKKYDCAGICLFVSQTHSEYVNEIFPSWGVITPEGVNGIRFRSKRQDFPTKEAQDAATGSSAHVVTSIHEWTRQLHVQMRDILQVLRKHMRIGWSTWGEPDSVPGDGL